MNLQPCHSLSRLLFAFALLPVAALTAPAKWTVLIYGHADHSLTSALLTSTLSASGTFSPLLTSTLPASGTFLPLLDVHPAGLWHLLVPAGVDPADAGPAGGDLAGVVHRLGH